MASNLRERELSEASWLRVEPLLTHNPPQPLVGRLFLSNKACFAGIVYVLRNVIHLKDMPEQFPSSTACWNLYACWTKLGVWKEVWAVVLEELQAAGVLDLSELAMDATFAESRGGCCLGATKYGVGNKIELVVDAANVPETILGPAALAIMPIPAAGDAVPVLADKAYDSDDLREHLADEGFVLITPHRSNRVRLPLIDGRRLRLYKRRWKVERTFAWLHSYRRVVTRHEKSCQWFEGFVQLACAIMALGSLI